MSEAKAKTITVKQKVIPKREDLFVSIDVENKLLILKEGAKELRITKEQYEGIRASFAYFAEVISSEGSNV